MKMPEETTISRRNWLKTVSLYGLVGAALASLGTILLDVWLAAGRFTTAHWSQVAAVEEVAAEGAVPFPGLRVAIIRQGNRFGALSLECSHLGCLVNAVDQGFFCPCHGSEFGPLGEVYSGPAPTALPWYPLQIRNGQLWIHTGRKLAKPVWVSLEQHNPAQGENHNAHA
jgi:cytochrome b6-f complex iron-sulfur subunit